MNGKNLYVGNLNYQTTKEQLQELFSQYGNVVDVKVIANKGFGFVEMATSSEAEEVKAKLNGFNFMGRPMKIDEAKPKRENNNRRPNFKRF